MAQLIQRPNTKPAMVPFREKFTPTRWGDMFSRSVEDSAHPEITVVLVPGMIISSRYMIPLAIRLAPYCNVHMIDFPGYGKSAKPPEVLEISQLAETLKDWMVSNNQSRAVFIANSFGCQIVAEFASRFPELVDKVVLQGPTVDPSARSLLRQMFRLKLNSLRESKSVGMISVKDYRSAGISRVIRTIGLTMHDHIEEKLPYIQAPTLIVRGSRDPVSPQAWVEKVNRLIPNSDLVVIPGGAHTLNYSEPDKFSEVILKFLGLNDGQLDS